MLGKAFVWKGCAGLSGYQDSQESLLNCENLKDSTGQVSELPVYKDLFAQAIQTQMKISAILKKKFGLKKKLIKEMKSKS